MARGSGFAPILSGPCSSLLPTWAKQIVMSMTFSPELVLFTGLVYLAILCAVAWITEQRFSDTLMSHPAIYTLSLGVIAGAWAIYAIIELAYLQGYSFFSYYIGIVSTFLLAPLLLIPMLRLCRLYQLSSLADLLTFRFRSQWVGALVTLCMVATLLPLLALQIKVISDSTQILSPNTSANFSALLFCLATALFTIVFGANRASGKRRHNGLIAVIAFQSFIKLIMFMALGGASVYGIFGGFTELNHWLIENPETLELMSNPMHRDSARTLLIIFFAGAVAMPHIFHMVFVTQATTKALYSASWAMPLFLMLMSLPVLPILWSGLKIGSTVPVEYTALAIGPFMDSPVLTIAAYIGGLSAASAVIIVSTLALANMCLKHLLLPCLIFFNDSSTVRNEQDIYGGLHLLGRGMIAAIIAAGYLFFQFMESTTALSNLGMVAFIGTLQFLPAILTTLYWPRANSNGLIAGLTTGFLVWLYALFLPAIGNHEVEMIELTRAVFFSHSGSTWETAAIVSLSANVCIFVLISLLTRTRDEENIAAEICSTNDLNRPLRYSISVNSPDEFHQRLAQILGGKNATVEISRALNELQFSYTESRPYALRQLRDRVEANLSGLLGPAAAYEIVNRCMPYKSSDLKKTEDINLIEKRLETTDIPLSGLAADLDNLRRHHRQTLQTLPIGVSSLAADGEILMWNKAMEDITGIAASTVVGSLLSSIPAPWHQLLQEFTDLEQSHNHKLKVKVGDHQNMWLNLHKSFGGDTTSQDRIIVLEDITDYQRLEQELMHTERLASIGRLAAGIAHEIGNPVTGIACLAQNLKYEASENDVREAVDDILTQTDRVSRIVHSLVNFSHSGSSQHQVFELQSINVADCCEEALHLLLLDKEAKQVTYSNDCDEQHFVTADEQRLLQILINLLSNARDASPIQGKVCIESRLLGEYVAISISDDGGGIPEQLREQVFEPFFTTKEPGEGTGLGLPLVYSIVNELGGKVSISDQTTSGAEITVTLPCARTKL